MNDRKTKLWSSILLQTPFSQKYAILISAIKHAPRWAIGIYIVYALVYWYTKTKALATSLYSRTCNKTLLNLANSARGERAKVHSKVQYVSKETNRLMKIIEIVHNVLKLPNNNSTPIALWFFVRANKTNFKRGGISSCLKGKVNARFLHRGKPWGWQWIYMC